MILKTIKTIQKSALLKGIIFLFAAFVFIALPSNKAQACSEGCFCEFTYIPDTLTVLADEHADTGLHIIALYLEHSAFLIFPLLYYIVEAMAEMTEQLTAIAINQALMIGTMLDAKIQLETLRTVQRLETEVMKDYTPSVGVCEIATNMRSLASSDRYTITNAHVLSQRSQDRQLGHINTSAVEGEHKDRASRLDQYITRYCQPEDNAGGLGLLCPASPPDEHKNKDINYSQLIDTPRTIGIDFCDSNALGDCIVSNDADESDEIDIWALANNLYSHDILLRVPDGVFQDPGNQNIYLDIRSLIAKRSVAENSFNIITAMKTKGNPDVGQIDPGTGLPAAHIEDTKAYFHRLLAELGMPAAQMDAFLGEYPSYYAQMEILTKKMYQRPEFYTELYEHPSNVERKSTALRAIDLMQGLDTLKSSLRTEMMLSLLLEVELTEVQKAIENNLIVQRP